MDYLYISQKESFQKAGFATIFVQFPTKPSPEIVALQVDLNLFMLLFSTKQRSLLGRQVSYPAPLVNDTAMNGFMTMESAVAESLL
jgi:hypothetical protein